MTPTQDNIPRQGHTSDQHNHDLRQACTEYAVSPKFYFSEQQSCLSDDDGRQVMAYIYLARWEFWNRWAKYSVDKIKPHVYLCYFSLEYTLASFSFASIDYTMKNVVGIYKNQKLIITLLNTWIHRGLLLSQFFVYV